MLNYKKILLVFFLLLFSDTLLAHQIAGMDLTVKLVNENKILINGFNKKTKTPLNGNKIKLYSMVNNKILFEGYLENGSLETTIPNLPYAIYMYVGSQDVVIEGIPPKEGFSGIYASKTNRAFYYSLFFSLFFILVGISIILKREFYLKKIRN